MIVQRVIWNNQFAVEILKILTLGNRSKEKIGVIEWEPSILKKNMGSLCDSCADENGGHITGLYKRYLQNGSAPHLLMIQIFQPQDQLQTNIYNI